MVRIRVATPADAPAIAALYRGLSPHSALMRFSGHLSGEALERVAALAPGTYALVGEEHGRLVAEARWCTGGDLPEVAITVADDFQCLGLGPVLLEKLRAAARRDGIPALTVMVRTDNLAMIRLLQHVGCAIAEPVRDGEAMVEIGADDLMPGWPDRDGRVRVLVESRSLLDDEGTKAARAAGYEVRKCLLGRPGLADCPLLKQGRCRLAEGADVVACLVPESAGKDALADAHRAAGRRVLTSIPEWRRAVPDLVAG